MDVTLELGEHTADDEIEIGGVEYVVKNVQADATGVDEADTNDPLAVCVKNWKAGAADSKKGMFSCFDESGMFVSVCKHGILIRYCDQIRSGEL